MSQIKTYKIIMLPTEKATNLGIRNFSDSIKTKVGKLAFLYPFKDQSESTDSDVNWDYQHLYIISDDEIKEGDWVINSNTNNIAQYTGHGSMEWWKKIVATTDKSLRYKEEVTGITKLPLDFNIPTIPEAFIQSYIKSYNEGNPITEVDLEMVRCVEPHLATMSSREYYIPETRSDNTVIIHPSKMYSKKDVFELFQKYFESQGISEHKRVNFDSWFEENV